ncbi:hypothetical protein R1flu_015237 [Riccia fluitans]|uniref:RRM domain-containing protein n=1 Tax=Riccia fluitans TaxID=41844 RepID=A0ABD1YID4_9MARC
MRYFSSSSSKGIEDLNCCKTRVSLGQASSSSDGETVSNVLAWSLQNFYEDIFEELGKYGELESLNVCDNLADHMVGNVYFQFREEEQAAAVLQALQWRFYAGRPIVDFFL